MASSDSHATMRQESWPDYLESKYHDQLPRLTEENRVYTSSMGMISVMMRESDEALAAYDIDGAFAAGGTQGLWDVDVRLREMDREGIAAEIVYCADQRVQDLFHSITNQKYPLDVCEAGIRAWHRWAVDTFGSAQDRLMFTALVGPAHDMEATLAETRWVKNHGFVAAYVPNFVTYPGAKSLYDPYWEPYWQLADELELVLVVHGGYGIAQGSLFPHVQSFYDQLQGKDATANLAAEIAQTVFTTDFLEYAETRRPMWQLMFGGVFDRYPNLKLMMTEVRGDWLPATFEFLDNVYQQHRDVIPAKRKPSEYWESNCLVGLSFMHRAEVPMRYEIGLDTIAFGRDYPHAESMWPNTKAWLGDALHGVPEEDVRKMCGENLIRFFGFDRVHLDTIAQRIGPTYNELVKDAPQIPETLIGHFDLRGGYLKEAEGDKLVPACESLLSQELAQPGLISAGARG